MQHNAFSIIAPSLQAPGHSQAETFGAVVWLWMQSPQHRTMPLHVLSTLLLPVLRCGQFILASAPPPHAPEQAPRPVAYLAWACFSAEAENRYLHHPPSAMRESDWCSGDRMWLIDAFTPFGHARAFNTTVQQLLPDICARYLHHRGDERGLRVRQFRGSHVTKTQEQQWWAERPLSGHFSTHKKASPAAAAAATTPPERQDK